jgi:dephospho-CoA kinase
MPYVVGLTGGIGSGKSTVAAYFVELGALVVDADTIARDLTKSGSPVLEELQAVFGEDVVDSTGNLDRKLLAARAFSSPENTNQLNSIMHQRIREQAAKDIESFSEDSIVVYDMPLLLETDSTGMCDFVVVVDSPVDQRIERLAWSRGMTEQEVRQRMALQASPEERNAIGDFVITNDQDLTKLIQECHVAWSAIISSMSTT